LIWGPIKGLWKVVLLVLKLDENLVAKMLVAEHDLNLVIDDWLKGCRDVNGD
jgi:hypothetical protein